MENPLINDTSYYPDSYTFQLQPVLIWGRDNDLVSEAINYIKVEFEENLSVFSVNEIVDLINRLNTVSEDLDAEIENYDFHIIKLHSNHIELILKNSTRHILEDISDLETSIDQLARKIIQYARDNPDVRSC